MIKKPLLFSEDNNPNIKIRKDTGRKDNYIASGLCAYDAAVINRVPVGRPWQCIKEVPCLACFTSVASLAGYRVTLKTNLCTRLQAFWVTVTEVGRPCLGSTLPSQAGFRVARWLLVSVTWSPSRWQTVSLHAMSKQTLLPFLELLLFRNSVTAIRKVTGDVTSET